MDQDSFRRLLQTPKPGASHPPSSANGRGPLPSAAAKPKTIDASQPAFKPRKIKKASESSYRDRAAERRQGGGNDYAQVEAVLEEFEKQHANADKEEVEEKRRYLGGDSDHSILVKGLDMALLQANRAKAAAAHTEDDDTLEKAFAGEDSVPAAPKKRTREELLRELKGKRGQVQSTDDHAPSKTAEEEAMLLEEAKKAGKFKPIGFKPIAEEKPKKKKAKNGVKEEERKKKKRRLEEKNGEETTTVTQDFGKHPKSPATSELPVQSGPQPTASTSEIKESEPGVPDDFNIFGDVEEYQGLDLDDEGEEENTNTNLRGGEAIEGGPSTVISQRWIPMDEDDLPIESSDQHPLPMKSHSPPPRHRGSRSPVRQATSLALEEGEMEQEEPVRLEPLSSSALPSIKDFLAMQEAAEAEEIRKKRKEKKAKANK